MLQELSIHNLAIIEKVNMTFYTGFQVFTGETGVGKSIIFDAINLIIGGRGSSDIIRHGCDKALIEAQFNLPLDHSIWSLLRRLDIAANPEELLLLRRELSVRGKSSAKINGQSVTLSLLKEVGEYLVNLHGQHEHQSLLRSDKHLQWLDLFSGDGLFNLLAQYRKNFKEYQQIQKKIHDLTNESRQKIQLADLYRFQLEEIAAAELNEEEEAELLEEKNKLLHFERLNFATGEAYELLNGSAGLATFAEALSHLEEMKNYDAVLLQPLVEQFKSAYYTMEDCTSQLRHYKETQTEADPQQLTQIENRLDLIHQLKRKYGETIATILSYEKQIQSEIQQLDHHEQLLEQLRLREKQLIKEMQVQSEQLTRIRSRSADKLAGQIKRELEELQMPHVIFKVHLKLKDQLTSLGRDEAEFVLSPNVGEPLKPLNKIASGGEMARIMLALKAIFAGLDRISVLIFDEVDSGVSGRAAQAVADKLVLLSKQYQVFAITHLPQIACMADEQYQIYKQNDGKDGRTKTELIKLSEEERIDEIARILGGVEVTDKTRLHAKEMISLAKQKNRAITENKEKKGK